MWTEADFGILSILFIPSKSPDRGRSDITRRFTIEAGNTDVRSSVAHRSVIPQRKGGRVLRQLNRRPTAQRT